MRFDVNADDFKARPLHADARPAASAETNPMQVVFALEHLLFG